VLVQDGYFGMSLRRRWFESSSLHTMKVTQEKLEDGTPRYVELVQETTGQSAVWDRKKGGFA